MIELDLLLTVLDKYGFQAVMVAWFIYRIDKLIVANIKTLDKVHNFMKEEKEKNDRRNNKRTEEDDRGGYLELPKHY